MKFNDFKTTCKAYVPFDKGAIYNKGISFIADNYKMSATYNPFIVEHIWYQEKGFKHYLTGEFIDVNRHFIEEDTVNAIAYLVASSNAGEKSTIMAFNKRTVQARDSLISQGVISKSVRSVNND